MKFIKPEKLNTGDTIGVISPSAGLAKLFPHRVSSAEKALKELGYKIKFATHSLESQDYVSSSIENRVDDIHEMFRDNEVKLIMCAIGGNHSNQLIKHLDYKLILDNPKIFIGYSDITVLHWAIITKAHLMTFYGPCLITEFGEHPQPYKYTVDYFKKALCQNTPIGIIQPSNKWTDELLDWGGKKDLERPRRMKVSAGYQWWREGEVSGNIFGGCVSSINHLAGTEYWIDSKDKILFIDLPEGEYPGTPLALSKVDSYLADLDNLNIFKNIKGLIIGRPYTYKKIDENKLKKIINAYTANYKYPILYNANIGHTSPIATIPMNSMVHLKSSDNIFEILEGGVI